MALDREQVRRHAELDKPPNLRRPPWGTIAQEYILALLAELEEAERQQDTTERHVGECQRLINTYESRLTKVPALVEAHREIAEWASESETGWYPGDLARKALAAWDAE